LISRRRRAAGASLLALAIAGALLILLPSLLRVQWMARLALRETSLLVTLLGVLALPLVEGRRRLGAALAAIVGLLPFASQAWLLGRDLSLREYALWGQPLPDVTVERDVVLEPSRPELTADIWRGTGAGPRPLLVTVHGGSWRSGDKGEPDHVHRQLAAAGYTVVDVRYRLAPGHLFPAAIEDVKCLAGRARELAGVDPDRVALLGRSAGGQIVLVAAYSAGDPRLRPGCAVPDRPVRAVVSLYGPADLVWGFENPMRPDVIEGNDSLRIYLGGTPGERPEAYRLGSALSWTDRPLPPTLLVHGDGDQIVRLEHSRRLAAALREHGHVVELVRVPWGEHGFDFRPGGLSEQIARRAILDFLAASLR
jgi:acetyl esterase/lipase